MRIDGKSCPEFYAPGWTLRKPVCHLRCYSHLRSSTSKDYRMNRFHCLIATISLLIPFLAGAQTPGLHVDETAVRFSFPAGHFLAEIPIGNTGSATSAQVAVDL